MIILLWWFFLKCQHLDYLNFAYVGPKIEERKERKKCTGVVIVDRLRKTSFVGAGAP